MRLKNINSDDFKFASSVVEFGLILETQNSKVLQILMVSLNRARGSLGIDIMAIEVNSLN